MIGLAERYNNHWNIHSSYDLLSSLYNVLTVRAGRAHTVVFSVLGAYAQEMISAVEISPLQDIVCNLGITQVVK